MKITAKEFTALTKLLDAWQELKLLGWEEPRYFKFPPDGKPFQLIELGSTGIHEATRRDGFFWVDYDWPSHPFLVRGPQRRDNGGKIG